MKLNMSKTTFQEISVGDTFIFQYELKWYRWVKIGNRKLSHKLLSYIGNYEKTGISSYKRAHGIFIDNRPKYNNGKLPNVRGACMESIEVYKTTDLF